MNQETSRIYLNHLDAANYTRLNIVATPTDPEYVISLQQAGVFAGGIAPDGTATFDWQALQTLVNADGDDMASVIARLLIAAREAGKKEAK